MDHPSIGGPSPKVSITVAGENVEYFRGHSLNVAGELPWVTASGCEGLTSLKVHVGKAAANQKCRVKLYFSEPGPLSDGERVFDVALQGKPVLQAFDIWKEAGGSKQGVVRSFNSAASNGTIDVTFKASAGRPLLSGIEIVTLAD